jgi:hypothetical protein
MDPRLQELIDHHEIRQTLARYCHGCDRCDEVEMADAYCADSWDDHGKRKMQGRQFAFESVEEQVETTNLVSHQLGQSFIRVRGDEAGCETYFIATVIYPGKDGTDTLNQLGGRYVDTLRREDGKWLIKKRLCVREWSITHPITVDWLAGAGFIETRRGPKDVSYETLDVTYSGKLSINARPAG